MLRHTLFVTSIFVAGVLCAPLAFAGEEMVPDVVGLNIQKAKALMDGAGFPIRVENVSGKPLGIVFSQDPGGLSEHDTSLTITLRVGGPTPKPGPGPLAPPAGALGTPPGGTRPSDMPPSSATTPDTTHSSTTPPSTTPPSSSGEAWPTNPADRPAAAGFVWNGTPVPGEALANTNGPDLPGVLGQTAGRARRALSQYRVRIEQTSAMPELVGQVLNQWPFAGSRLALGEEVTIVVGVGSAPTPAHRGVPQVQDQPWRDACRAVERAGFQIQLTAVPSPDSKRGAIVMQTPLPGSLLERGQVMHLRIGAGTGRYEPGRAGPGASADAPSDNPAGGETTSGAPATPPAGSGASPLTDTPLTDRPPTDTPTRPAPVDKPPQDAPTAPPPGGTPPANDRPSRDEPQTPAAGRHISAPALRTPPAGESYPFKYGADFTWTAVASATSYELEIQEELPSGAWQKLASYTVTGTKFRPKRLERGRYRWRVRAITPAATGTWSQFRRLYMY